MFLVNTDRYCFAIQVNIFRRTFSDCRCPPNKFVQHPLFRPNLQQRQIKTVHYLLLSIVFVRHQQTLRLLPLSVLKIINSSLHSHDTEILWIKISCFRQFLVFIFEGGNIPPGVQNPLKFSSLRKFFKKPLIKVSNMKTDWFWHESCRCKNNLEKSYTRTCIVRQED